MKNKMRIIAISLFILVVIFVSLRKPIGGIKGIYTTYNVSGEMVLDKSGSDNVLSKVNVEIKGFNFFSKGVFKGTIILDGEEFVTGDNCVAYASNEGSYYLISVIKLPEVSDNGIDLLTDGKNLAFSIDKNQAYLTITEGNNVTKYKLSLSK